MQLATFLQSSGLSAAEFGRRIGVGRATVTRWLSGDRLPNDRELMAKIFHETGGQVTANDFFGLSPEQPLEAEAETAADHQAAGQGERVDTDKQHPKAA